MSFEVKDPHRFINDLDKSTIQSLVMRLESRSRDKAFSNLILKYAAQLSLPESAIALEIGCGTGATTRFLAQRDNFSGKAYAVDQCPDFIDVAKRFAKSENISDRIEFSVGDAHQLNFPDSMFDVVIAHTLISHVSDPETVIQEMARVVKPDGTLVIFDGDYSSLTIAYPEHEFGQQMDHALAKATFNNTLIMQDLPHMLPRFGLEICKAWGDAIIEIGQGSYFKSFIEAYAPFVKHAGLIDAALVDKWLTDQLMFIHQRSFFACCNYYTYLIKCSANGKASLC
jgi:ubiquinone/menaquinone biosynthesis C-methylase UbiE